MDSEMLTQAFERLRANLTRSRFRQAIVLQGDTDWRIQQLLKLEPSSGLWIGASTPDPRFQAVPPGSVSHLLGQEFDCAIFSAEQGFDADALGIVSGLIRAGGILWILLPEGDFTNPANQRFLSYPFQNHQAWSNFQRHFIRILKHQAWWLTPDTLSAFEQPNAQTRFASGLTPDQQQGLLAIEQVAFGHRKRPLVIEADRGRGKTALLGFAAAQLVQQGKRIILCAARYAQCETAFIHAAQQLKCDHQPGLVTTPSGSIRFHAPDDLILNHPPCDLLMIDEAAHLPTPMLQHLVSHYPRVVFATTLHGYEGSGRGFSLRFKPILAQNFPQHKVVKLQQPIRWSQGDPLEKLINQALCLDIDLPDLGTSAAGQSVEIRATTPNHLTTDQIKNLFALLVHAHYQTSPADLQHLMTAPDLTLYLAEKNQQLLGAMLVCEEGKLPEDISINRRVKGHLVPQLLRQHSGINALIGLQSQRVLRLAVHPQVRRQGIASQLIQYWQQCTPELDFRSASFGVTHDLYHFWRQLGFQSMHIGAKRDKASGTHNLVMAQGEHPLLQKVQQHFQVQLPHSLMETLTRLPPGLVVDLLAESTAAKVSNTTRQAVQAYAEGDRPYESVSQALWQWTIENPQSLQQHTETEQAVWLDKVVRKQDWQAVAQNYRLAGRKGIETLLKNCLQPSLVQ